MPGDSHKLISNQKYVRAFTTVCNYADWQYKHKEDYFPVFFMGKSIQVYVKINSVMENTLVSMRKWRN
jgi:hypothetical protein